jgi:hypothetical protein
MATKIDELHLLIDVYNKNHKQYPLNIIFLIFRQMVEMEEGERRERTFLEQLLHVGTILGPLYILSL